MYFFLPIALRHSVVPCFVVSLCRLLSLWPWNHWKIQTRMMNCHSGWRLYWCATSSVRIMDKNTLSDPLAARKRPSQLQNILHQCKWPRCYWILRHSLPCTRKVYAFHGHFASSRSAFSFFPLLSSLFSHVSFARRICVHETGHSARGAHVNNRSCGRRGREKVSRYWSVDCLPLDC